MDTTPFESKGRDEPGNQASRTEFDPSSIRSQQNEAGWVLGDVNALWAETGAPRRDGNDADEALRFPQPVQSS